MRRKISNQISGAIAIEASLGIFFFLLSICCIMFFAQFARLESQMQYAVNQTAKELSMYYYVLDALDLAQYTSDANKNDKNREDLNKTINAFSTFMGDVDDTLSIDWDFGSLESAGNTLEKGKEAATNLYSSGGQLFEQLKALGDDPIGKIKVILRIIVSAGKNQVVAPLLCREFLPKYISDGDVDEYLQSFGLEHGLSDLDFSYSSILDDGRSIKIAVVYKVNTKKLTFGLVNTDIMLRQVAVTAAWVTPSKEKNLNSIVDAFKNGTKESADDPNKDKKSN